jgi:DNA polymerase III delta prime subunit
MQQAIGDQAAIAFAVGFYDALGAGQSFEFAYQLGCSAIQLEGIPESLTPTLNGTGHPRSDRPASQVATPASVTTPPPVLRSAEITPHNQQDRQALLSKVRNFWLKGVLEASLHGRALLELGLTQRADAIDHPWSLAWETPTQARQTLPSAVKIIDLFDDLGVGATLLVLGAPGSGKTITLLQLTRSLVARAEQTPAAPLPVVFNLSAWEGQSLASWLTEELSSKYQLPKPLANRWLEQQTLTLMLDGLDEVAEYRREDCVKAINQFSQQHGRTAIVVCSRLKDYGVLTHRLRFQGAVHIQPLTQEQVQGYLSQAGDALQGVREALVQNAQLRELAQSPLILSVMTIAYQGVSQSEIQHMASADNLTQPLLQRYVSLMLSRQGQQPPYRQAQVETWLQWLALKLLLNAQSIFSLEQMQPQQFLKRRQLGLYRLGVGLILGLSYGFLFGFVYRSVIAAPMISAIALPAFGDVWQPFLEEWLWQSTFMNIIFPHTLALDIGPTLGMMIGVLGTFPTAILGQFDRISPIESLQFSWQKARRIILGGILFGIVALHWSGGLGGGLVVSLVISLLFSFGWVSARIEEKTVPNEGIWRSALIASTLILLVDLSVVLDLFQFTNPYLFQHFIQGLGLGFSIGLVMILRSKPVIAGVALVQHSVLRTLLWVSGYTPRNYARFLRYATRCALMQQVGGSYVFLHRLFLEYFALKD